MSLHSLASSLFLHLASDWQEDQKRKDKALRDWACCRPAASTLCGRCPSVAFRVVRLGWFLQAPWCAHVAQVPVWNTPQLPLAVFSLSLPPVVHLQPVTAEYPSSRWHVFGLANALSLPQHLVGEWETYRTRWWKRSSSNSGPLCPCPAVLKLLPTSFFLNYLLIDYFGLCSKAFSSCGERRLFFTTVRGLLTAVTSLVVEHRLGTQVVGAHGLSSCGFWA